MDRVDPVTVTGDDLMSRAQALLACLVNSLADQGGTPGVEPAVVAGDFAWDGCTCGDGPQVMVRLVNTYPSAGFPGTDALRARGGCADGWAAVYELAIIRCADGTDESTLAAFGDHAVLANAACTCCAGFKRAPFLSDCVIGTTLTQGPTGQCIGTTLQIIVEIPGCCS